MAVATLVLRTHAPIDFIVTNTQGVEKGTLMMLSGTRLASPSTGTANEVFAGVAHREKIALDGRTRLALHTRGIFRMTANSSENITLGAMVCLSGANLIRDAIDAELEAGQVIGKALQAITAGSAGEIKIGGTL